MIDIRKICTKEQPIYGFILNVKHPDAMLISTEDNNNNELWECKNCKYRWWKEGFDAWL